MDIAKAILLHFQPSFGKENWVSFTSSNATKNDKQLITSARTILGLGEIMFCTHENSRKSHKIFFLINFQPQEIREAMRNSHKNVHNICLK